MICRRINTLNPYYLVGETRTAFIGKHGVNILGATFKIGQRVARRRARPWLSFLCGRVEAIYPREDTFGYLIEGHDYTLFEDQLLDADAIGTATLYVSVSMPLDTYRLYYPDRGLRETILAALSDFTEIEGWVVDIEEVRCTNNWGFRQRTVIPTNLQEEG